MLPADVITVAFAAPPAWLTQGALSHRQMHLSGALEASRWQPYSRLGSLWPGGDARPIV